MLHVEHWLPLVIVAIAPFVGSFLGVLIERLPRNQPALWSRSACMACGQKLAPQDMIPIVRWIALKGRCRHCGTQIGVLAIVVELLALAIAVWALLAVPVLIVPVTVMLGWLLIPLAIIDWRHYRLPDSLTIVLAIAGLAAIVLVTPSRFPDHLIGAILGYLSMIGLAALYRLLRGRAGLGQGDAKLLGAIGMWVAWEGLAGVVLLASFFATITILIQRFGGREFNFSSRISFGTHLAASGWLIWLYGPLYFGQ